MLVALGDAWRSEYILSVDRRSRHYSHDTRVTDHITVSRKSITFRQQSSSSHPLIGVPNYRLKYRFHMVSSAWINHSIIGFRIGKEINNLRSIMNYSSSYFEYHSWFQSKSAHQKIRKNQSSSIHHNTIAILISIISIIQSSSIHQYHHQSSLVLIYQYHQYPPYPPISIIPSLITVNSIINHHQYHQWLRPSSHPSINHHTEPLYIHQFIIINPDISISSISSSIHQYHQSYHH